MYYPNKQFTSKVTVYVGSEGLSLSITFKSLSIRGCFPNDISLLVGKIDDNADLAVFITEYSHLDSLKFVSAILYQIFISHQMITLQKLWKMFFISSKKLFPFSRYSRYSPLFLLDSHCFRSWSKINLKIYDVINCQNKNLITHFEKEKSCGIETLSIDRVLNKEHFYGNIMQEICTKS